MIPGTTPDSPLIYILTDIYYFRFSRSRFCVFVYLYHDPGAPFIINLRQGLIQKVCQICYQ